MYFVLRSSYAMQRQKRLYMVSVMSVLPGRSAWRSGEGIKYEDLLYQTNDDTILSIRLGERIIFNTSTQHRPFPSVHPTSLLSQFNIWQTIDPIAMRYLCIPSLLFEEVPLPIPFQYLFLDIFPTTLFYTLYLLTLSTYERTRIHATQHHDCR